MLTSRPDLAYEYHALSEFNHNYREQTGISQVEPIFHLSRTNPFFEFQHQRFKDGKKTMTSMLKACSSMHSSKVDWHKNKKEKRIKRRGGKEKRREERTKAIKKKEKGKEIIDTINTNVSSARVVITLTTGL